MKKVKELKKWIELYGEVHAAAEELELAYEYVKEEIITEEEVDAAYKKALHLLEDLEFRNMLRDEADQMSCVLKINSGAGGTESQDWASMLMRMYQRWAENNGYKISIANYQEGDEAGIKTVTIDIEGDYAYGYLKSENGVHRLVRVSPYNAQGKQINYLETVKRPEISAQIAEARDKGDLSENAEYDAAKEAQGIMEAKLAQLKGLISNARLIDESRVKTDEVQILNKVKIKNTKNNAVMTYTLVSDSEANLKEGKISVSTPIAQGLMGKKVGDVVEIRVPSGLMTFEIMDISI